MHIKTSMLLVEITAMLYIGNRKIRFGRVFHRPTDSIKSLHLDIVYLSPTSASVFRRRLPWFGASMGMHSGVPSGLHSTYASIHRKMRTVSPVRHVWSSFKFRLRP